MNQDRLQTIFDKYIKDFSRTNNQEHSEYYKWIFAKAFSEFDLDCDNFADELKRLVKLSSNIINSRSAYPFSALSMLAQEEPDTVRALFKALFADDHHDLTLRQEKIAAFIRGTDELRQRYHMSAYIYENNQRSAMLYLAYRFPDENYAFKATEARTFADCVEYYEDWGTMKDFRMDAYYRMCDQLVEAIRLCPALTDTAASRFDGRLPDIPVAQLYPDAQYHLLAFDIIYCAHTYDYYSGIPVKLIHASARRLYQENRAKALQYEAEFTAVCEQKKECDEAVRQIARLFAPDTRIIHKSLGSGVILPSDTEGQITILFDSGSQQAFDTILCACRRIIRLSSDDRQDELEALLPRVQQRTSIDAQYKVADMHLKPYQEYLG